jgi:Uma2 family endonuclease
MAGLTIELPPQQEQTEINLRRWAELLADGEMAKFEGRIETDRHGHALLSPLADVKHGNFQAELGCLLRTSFSIGRVFIECPISTADGVRVADVAWASPESVQELGDKVCFPRGPEIRVEIVSASNSRTEIKEKVALFFDAGAKEVWLCSESGLMTFFAAGTAQPMPASKLSPEFPAKVELS